MVNLMKRLILLFLCLSACGKVDKASTEPEILSEENVLTETEPLTEEEA